MKVFAVAPISSSTTQKLCRAGFQYAAAGTVDRGDGYTILCRVTKDRISTALVELLRSKNISAWKRWR